MPAEPRPTTVAAARWYDRAAQLEAELLAAQERYEQTNADCVEYIDRMENQRAALSKLQRKYNNVKAQLLAAQEREKALREALAQAVKEFHLLGRPATAFVLAEALAGSPSEKPGSEPAIHQDKRNVGQTHTGHPKGTLGRVRECPDAD